MRALTISLALLAGLLLWPGGSAGQDVRPSSQITFDALEELSILIEPNPSNEMTLTTSGGSLSAAGLSGAELAAACCKVCRKGKACGNSCIKKSYTCHQPPGGACDGN